MWIGLKDQLNQLIIGGRLENGSGGSFQQMGSFFLDPGGKKKKGAAALGSGRAWSLGEGNLDSEIN